jgi:hypothetical protein
MTRSLLELAVYLSCSLRIAQVLTPADSETRLGGSMTINTALFSDGKYETESLQSADVSGNLVLHFIEMMCGAFAQSQAGGECSQSCRPYCYRLKDDFIMATYGYHSTLLDYCEESTKQERSR